VLFPESTVFLQLQALRRQLRSESVVVQEVLEVVFRDYVPVDPHISRLSLSFAPQFDKKKTKKKFHSHPESAPLYHACNIPPV
jgi:hypothetical protein